MPIALIHIITFVTLVILTSFVYGHTLSYSFHFDDYYFITENLQIRDVSDIKAIWNSLAKPSRFLGMYSFALNYHFHGLEVVGYHIVNILIHMINGFLTYWLCVMTMGIGGVAGKRRYWAAGLAAAIFIVHPINTQAVTYVAQRFASMATMFYLLALCCYVFARLQSRPRIRWVFFVLSGVAAIAGMFTKQIVLTLPVIVILYELSFLQRGRRLQVAWWQWLLLVGLFLLVPTLHNWDFSRLFNVAIASRSHEGDTLTWSSYLFTQLRVVPTYIRLMFFPIGQTLDYDFAASTHILHRGAWAGALLLAGLLFWAVRKLKSDPLIGFGVCWFFLTMGLESSFVPIYQVIFEHRCYLPSVGFVLALATLLQRVMPRDGRLGVATILIVATLAWCGHQRNKVWQTEETLWQDIMQKAPQKVRSYIHLGVAYIMKGQYDKAISTLDAGIDIRQDNYRLYHNRGLAYEMKGNLKEAMWSYSKAIELHERSAVSLTNRAGLFIQIKRFQLALDDYNAALKIDPEYGNAYLGRGNLFFQFQKYKRALRDFEKATEYGVPIDPAEMAKVRRLAR